MIEGGALCEAGETQLFRVTGWNGYSGFFTMSKYRKELTCINSD